MNFKSFIKEKIIEIIFILTAIITIEIFLMMYEFDVFLKCYIPIIILLAYGSGIAIEFLKKRNFYQTNLGYLEKLKEKYMLVELLETPEFLEGKILKEFLEETNKSMIEQVNYYKYLQQDYKEYIELWIHEIKTPIATSKMIIENDKNETTKKIEEEIEKIENYIEQVLYYARSNTVEKDYLIKKYSLQHLVNEAIKKNKNRLIQEKIKVNIHEIEQEVYTDSKWFQFILNQIIQNSIQYQEKERKEKGLSEIEITSKKLKEAIQLEIKDNGIGIPKEEHIKVFEKSFTGSNGRLNGKKATGIGLYLCYNLCQKLGLGLTLESEEGVGTTIRMTFPLNSLTKEVY